MITVYGAAVQFCNDKELPKPSTNDLREIGRIASEHFRKSFIKTLPEGPVPGAGFVKKKEQGKDVVVIYYPDNYRDDLIGIIDVFYKKKAQRVVEKMHDKIEKPEVKADGKRKRIPLKTPVGSSNINKITQPISHK